MDNPWVDLPVVPPMALPADHVELERFNAARTPTSPFRFDTHRVLPEPFIGAVLTASVVVLQLNPGFNPDTDPASHASPDFRAALLGNLRHEPSERPFYYFDPRFEDHPGSVWWRGKTNALARAISPEHLAKRLAVVEWFPYKSAKFKPGCTVPSQQYNFELVRAAMRRKALIVVSRGERHWEDSVTGLKAYPRKLTLSSNQNITLSPNNLKFEGAKSPKAWEMLLVHLRDHV